MVISETIRGNLKQSAYHIYKGSLVNFIGCNDGLMVMLKKKSAYHLNTYIVFVEKWRGISDLL